MSPTATGAHTLRGWLADGTLDLPAPGGGRTPERWQALITLARRNDVSIARLAEAHVDALAILAEAGRLPVPDCLYGVWASDATGHELKWAGGSVSGRKRFCSGLGIVDRALVTAVDPSGTELLLDVDVRAGGGVDIDTSSWATPALAGSATGDVVFHDLPAPDAIVHPRHRWYLDRPGFWHGACGPAACWAGAAVGLVDAAEAMVGDGGHARAHLGGLRAAAWAMRSLLDQAGRETDRCPDDAAGARRRALAVRHLVERHCVEVIDRFGRALGPRPLVHHGDIAQRVIDLEVYIRQHHAERDLEVLGSSEVSDW